MSTELGLPDNAFRFPEQYSETVTLQRLKEIVMNSPELIFACGSAWEIAQKHLAPGVYRISLKPKERKP